MKSLLRVLLLTAVTFGCLSACAPVEDDESVEVDRVDQAVFIAGMPDQLLIQPSPSNQALNWTTYSAYWVPVSAANGITNYRPSAPNSVTGVAGLAGPSPCTRIGTSHNFSCNGTQVNCPVFFHYRTPTMWQKGTGGWMWWAASGSENWEMVDAPMVASTTTSSTSFSGGQATINCFTSLPTGNYRMRHK